MAVTPRQKPPQYSQVWSIVLIGIFVFLMLLMPRLLLRYRNDGKGIDSYSNLMNYWMKTQGQLEASNSQIHTALTSAHVSERNASGSMRGAYILNSGHHTSTSTVTSQHNDGTSSNISVSNTVYKNMMETIWHKVNKNISIEVHNNPSIIRNSYPSVNADIVIRDKHTDPHLSPMNGTDISSHPASLIKCHNQSRCIQPQLQLNKVFKVYFCKHIAYGVRFFYLAREGLLLHPNIHLVSDPNDAEIVVYLPVSSEWKKSECNNVLYRRKMIVIDEGDYQPLFHPDDGNEEWLLYFKRSYVNRHVGEYKGFMNYLDNPVVFPMTYPIAEAYIKTDFTPFHNRKMEFVCTLRGGPHDPLRQRIKEWTQQYAAARGVKNFIAGEVNHASRTTVDENYFHHLYNAKIIVTANPSGWEGDFRLMEAFGSGALIFVDKMYVPRPHPLIHGKHVIYYDNNNKTDFFDKLDYYRHHEQESIKVAIHGYLHTMKYHRTACLMDYIFRTAHIKLDPTQKSKYFQTGYDMKNIALSMRNDKK